MCVFVSRTSKSADPKKSILARRMETKRARWRELVNIILSQLAEDGSLTFDEFSGLLEGAQESKELFNALDVNDDGVLDIYEIRAFAEQK